MSGSSENRDEIRDLLRSVRREVQKFSKDLANATHRAVDSTEKAVKEASPRISATLDQSMKEASESLHRALGSLDNKTRDQQVKALRAYKIFISKQADMIEKRLRKLSE